MVNKKLLKLATCASSENGSLILSVRWRDFVLQTPYPSILTGLVVADKKRNLSLYPELDLSGETPVCLGDNPQHDTDRDPIIPIPCNPNDHDTTLSVVALSYEELSWLSLAVSRDEGRPNLTKLHIGPGRSGGERAVVACDGHRLHAVWAYSDKDADIPVVVLDAILATVGKKQTIGIGYRKGCAVWTGVDGRFCATWTDNRSEYPNWQNVIPSDKDYTGRIELGASTIKRVDVVARAIKDRTAATSFNTKGQVKVDSVECGTCDNTAGTIKCNAEFLKDAASGFGFDVTLQVHSDRGPMTIERGTRFALVMPIK